MARLVISVHFGVAEHSKLSLLYRYVNAAFERGHEIACIFVYQEAVYHSSNNISQPSDEINLTQIWQSFADKQIPLLMCVTAAEKRGIDLNNINPEFSVAGLAEFAMQASKADKWVQFK
ncbi:sulfurtransferase complex subunit TusD [Pseudoalteromonas sp. T1lg65]|uniref:sulfurtransferase complex subunit TusD n=1 Tax=Pseudoalteromonas sp. T1lg65 TaxID=2077101 RepID=UPI003F7A4581